MADFVIVVVTALGAGLAAPVPLNAPAMGFHV